MNIKKVTWGIDFLWRGCRFPENGCHYMCTIFALTTVWFKTQQPKIWKIITLHWWSCGGIVISETQMMPKLQDWDEFCWVRYVSSQNAPHDLLYKTTINHLEAMHIVLSLEFMCALRKSQIWDFESARQKLTYFYLFNAYLCTF